MTKNEVTEMTMSTRIEIKIRRIIKLSIIWFSFVRVVCCVTLSLNHAAHNTRTYGTTWWVAADGPPILLGILRKRLWAYLLILLLDGRPCHLGHHGTFNPLVHMGWKAAGDIHEALG